MCSFKFVWQYEFKLATFLGKASYIINNSLMLELGALNRVLLNYLRI